MDYSQDLVKGTFVPVILSLLESGPMYGYQMVKQVDARTNGRLKWREGTLYPTLHRMEADRLIESYWQDAPAGDGGRKRKYYAITRRGRGELVQRRREWQEFSGAVNAIVLGG